MAKSDSPLSEEIASERRPELLIAGFSAKSQHTNGTHQQPELARQFQTIAAPTLLKNNPLTKKMLIGDLSRIDRVLI